VSPSASLSARAHCRFGDKGDTGLFVLVPFDARDFDWLVATVSAERIARHLGGLEVAQVCCRPCPHLGVLVVAVRNLLAGGVTASLALDAHGKTLAGHLLAMRVPQ
jgi:hypothetical protein